VNYQRSLEGELARSMQTLGPVQSARVHLAIPKPTVFVKEQQKPSASVVLTLHPGRALDAGQVNAIVHLISSSIPSLSATGVTVVDQRGSLLSSIREGGSEAMDATQLKYVRQIEQDYIKRIEDIVAPLIGAQNVRAQVTADIDFSLTEQTAESFKPNQPPNQSSIRSIQSTESRNGVANPGGVPGALSNQPPVPATAPIVAPANTVTTAAGESTSMHKEATTNYEVDRTIRHTKQPVGSIRRLSVAVLINNRSTTDAKGKSTSKPFTPAEQAQLNNLVKNAMGFNAQRGDSLNLLNSAFNDVPEAALPEIPLWKQPEIIALVKEIFKYLLIAGAGLYLFFGIIRPALRNLSTSLSTSAAESETTETAEHEPAGEKEFAAKKSEVSYEGSVQAAKQIAQQNPQIVASVVKEWVNQ
jgi:flagellar M-ring protein FliF